MEIVTRTNNGHITVGALVSSFCAKMKAQCIERETFGDIDLNKTFTEFCDAGRDMLRGFVIDEQNKFVYGNLLLWALADGRMQCINPFTHEKQSGNLFKGLYIAGNPGSGKTWATRILNEFCRRAAIKIRFSGREEKLGWTSYHAHDITNGYITYGNTDAYKVLDVLCIQDLGNEPLESVYMGNRANVLAELLEHRGDESHHKLTIITSNLRINDPRIKELYGDRVASRLIGMCNYFELTGNDRRLN